MAVDAAVSFVIARFGGYDGILNDLEASITRVVIAEMPPQLEPVTPTPEASTPVPFPNSPYRASLAPPKPSPFSRESSAAGENAYPATRLAPLTLPLVLSPLNRASALNLPPSPNSTPRVMEPLFDSRHLINECIKDFVGHIDGYLKQSAVKTLLTTKSFKSLIDKELDSIRDQLDILQAEPAFRAVYNSSTADRDSRLVIMLIDAGLKAKTLQNGPFGPKLIATWRAKHPVSGGSRKTRKLNRQRAKYRRSKHSKHRKGK